MAQKPHFIDHQQREQRQRTYQAVATVAKQFPAVSEIAVELRFADQDGKRMASPYKRIFAPAMQAFFDFPCPIKECVGGGFNLSADIPAAVASKTEVTTGSHSCQGRRPRPEAKDARCLLELKYEVVVGKH